MIKKQTSKELEEKVNERTKELERIKKELVSILEDTQRVKKKAEEERIKTRAALTSLIDGLIVFDKEKRITLVNPEAERILDLKEELVINKKIDQVSNFPNLVKLYKALGQEIRWTGQIYELVIEGHFKRFFQIKTAPVVVEKEVVGMMVILHDVTRDKEIDKLKTEFVSIAAHQLRTPLSAIKWILRMVLDGDVGKISKEQADILTKGYQSNERMIILINDLLNVARVEEGRFIYNLRLQSMEKIIERAIENSNTIAKNKKIELIFKKPNEPLPQVNVDKKKIDLAIQNLLDNAIRFNKPGGSVTISISCDKINIEVMIKDTGIGIPLSQQKRLFTKFFRADNAMELVTEGTGLGLFICKNIIEAHQGKIWFESEKNKGTTFWFSLPIKI